MHDIEELTLDELDDRLARHAVGLPSFTDEELMAIAPGSPTWHLLPAPAFLPGAGEARKAALRTAVRSLHVRGYVGRAGDDASGSAVELHGALALVHGHREASATMVLASWPSGDRTVLWGSHGPTRYLAEEVHRGLHRFVLRSVERTAAWLATETVAQVADGAVCDAALVTGIDLATDHGERVRAHLRDGGARATVETAVAGEDGRRGHLTVLPLDDGLVAMSSAPTGVDDQSEVRAVRTGRLGLAALLLEWIRPAGVAEVAP